MSKLIKRATLDKELFNLEIVTDEQYKSKHPFKDVNSLTHEEKREIEGYYKELKLSVEQQDRYTKFLKGSLNSVYQTFTFILFMFLGYLITGFKYFGFSIWKDKTTIVFYIVMSLSALIIFLMELKRDRMDPNKEKKE